MRRVALDGFPAALQQFLGDVRLVVQEHLDHLLERVVRRLGIQLEQQLDAFHGHRCVQARAQAAGAHEHQLADAIGVFDGEVQRRRAPHRVADQVCPLDAEGVHQALDGAGVDQTALLFHHERPGLVEARRVLQDDPVAGVHERADVAVVVAPAARTRAAAVQHDDGLTAARFVVVNLEVGEPLFVDLRELAGTGFGKHVRFPVLERECQIGYSAFDVVGSRNRACLLAVEGPVATTAVTSCRVPACGPTCWGCRAAPPPMSGPPCAHPSRIRRRHRRTGSLRRTTPCDRWYGAPGSR